MESHLAKILLQFELFVNLFIKLELAEVGRRLYTEIISPAALSGQDQRDQAVQVLV